MKSALAASLLLALATVASAEDSLKSLVEKHCIDCHNDSTTEGELDLTASLLDTVSDEGRARSLDRIIARVSAGEMPPEDSDTLDEDDRKRLLTHSQAELNRLASRLRDDPGDVAMPRLTALDLQWDSGCRGYSSVPLDGDERVATMIAYRGTETRGSCELLE